MARNPWANWQAPAVGATANRNAQNRQAAATRRPVKNNGMPPLVPSLWRAPTGPQDNAFTRALEANGANAATNAYGQQPAAPGNNNGGGGGRGGGGGGGGGQPAITQAMIDAMAQALGVQGPTLQYQNLPVFRGQALGGFDPAPYRQQQQLVNQAVSADQANFTANQRATGQAVQGAYTNPYATAQVQSGPQTPVMGAGLMATAGGAASPQAANQVNAENTQNQGTFQDLLGILSANSQAGQNSRMQQVAMDANYGRQNLGAQALGLRGGIANAQTQAATQWRQQQQERAYQNSLMAQQYAVQNAQGRQATNQANWQQQNTALQARLQPILDLISQSAGVGGLNMAPLMAALRGRAA